MSDAKSNAFETALLGLIFNASSIALLAQTASTGGTTLLYVALHTADPTDSASSGQATAECSYTNYVRVAVDRSSSGWTVSGSSVHPTTNISFAQAGSTDTVTHFSVAWTTISTAPILYAGTVTPNIAVANGVTPRLTTASAITEA
jgi:predicted aconitase